MKDVERLILKSFAYAVDASKATLPEFTIQQSIQGESPSSLDKRIAELDTLARSSPLLEVRLSLGLQLRLEVSAAERGLGTNVLPADYDEDGPSNETNNIVSAPERYQLEEDRKTLDAIDSRLNRVNSKDFQQALSSDDPRQELESLTQT